MALIIPFLLLRRPRFNVGLRNPPSFGYRQLSIKSHRTSEGKFPPLLIRAVEKAKSGKPPLKNRRLGKETRAPRVRINESARIALPACVPSLAVGVCTHETMSRSGVGSCVFGSTSTLKKPPPTYKEALKKRKLNALCKYVFQVSLRIGTTNGNCGGWCDVFAAAQRL